MKMIRAAILLAMTAGALPAAADDTPRIDQRQARQQERIDQGVASGALTEKEAARLERGQARIQRKKARAAADGKITKAERRRIDRAQDRQSRRIHRQKHDRQAAN